MNRALVAVVAALLVSAGVVGGVLDEGAPTGTEADERRSAIDRLSVDDRGPSTTTDLPESNDDQHYMVGSERTRRLELGGEARSEVLTGSWSLGARIDAGDGVLESNYETSAFLNRVEGLSGDRKEQAITDYLRDLEDRVSALRTAEQRAVRAYARGESSATNLTRTLVRSHAEAKTLQPQLDRLAELSDSDSNEGFARALRFRLNTFRSPLRARLGDTLRGDTGDVRVSLRATENGYVLGTITDGQYLREALRYDYRRPEGPKAITSGGQLDDRQSTVYNVTTSFGIQQYYQGAGAYVGRMVYDFSDGEIRGYFDGGTGDVFFERNSYRLEDMDLTEAINTTNGSARLRVERTFFDGPIKVTVVDPKTGDPIDTRVRIAGSSVGQTGDDGTLWLVEPADPYAVAVTVNGTVVSDTVVND